MKLLFIYLSLIGMAISKPTAESLFRNGTNKEISSPTVVGLFEISKVGESVNEDPVYLKLIYNKNEKRINIFQYLYGKQEMKDNNLINVKKINSPRDFASDTNLSKSKRLFYSIYSSLLQNDSSLISSYLQAVSSSFKNINEVKNKQKERLLQRVKAYNKATKEDKSLIGVLDHPLKPNDPDKVDEVKDTMKQNFYSDDSSVVLKNKEGNLYWEVSSGSFNGTFDNSHHRILKLSSTDSNLEFKFSDYILFNGVHELPKFVYVKMENQDAYLIKALSLQHLNLNMNNLQKTFSKREKIALESTQINTVIPHFIY